MGSQAPLLIFSDELLELSSAQQFQSLPLELSFQSGLNYNCFRLFLPVSPIVLGTQSQLRREMANTGLNPYCTASHSQSASGLVFLVTGRVYEVITCCLGDQRCLEGVK